MARKRRTTWIETAPQCLISVTASTRKQPRDSEGPALTAVIAVALRSSVDPSIVVVVGLLVWGVIFALNSAVRSFLILHYAEGDRVAMNVGF